MPLADVMDSCMHARVVQQFKINIPLLLHRLIKSSAYIAIGFLRNQTYPICNLIILVLNNYRVCGQDGHDGEIIAEHTALSGKVHENAGEFNTKFTVAGSKFGHYSCLVESYSAMEINGHASELGQIS